MIPYPMPVMPMPRFLNNRSSALLNARDSAADQPSNSPSSAFNSSDGNA